MEQEKLDVAPECQSEERPMADDELGERKGFDPSRPLTPDEFDEVFEAYMERHLRQYLEGDDHLDEYPRDE